MVFDSGSSIIDGVAQGRQQLPALPCFINPLTSDLTPLTWDASGRESIGVTLWLQADFCRHLSVKY